MSTHTQEEQAWAMATAAYEIEADAITRAFEGVNKEDFLRAVNALKKAPRIGASGCGHSGIACQHFAHLMCCIERPRALSPPPKQFMARRAFCRRATLWYSPPAAAKRPNSCRFSKSARKKASRSSP